MRIYVHRAQLLPLSSSRVYTCAHEQGFSCSHIYRTWSRLERCYNNHHEDSNSVAATAWIIFRSMLPSGVS